MTIKTWTPFDQWLNQQFQMYGPGFGGLNIAPIGLPGDMSESSGLNSYMNPQGDLGALGLAALQRRGLTPAQFAQQNGLEYNAANNTVAQASNDDEQSGLNSFIGGPLTIAGIFGGIGGGLSALTGGATGGASAVPGSLPFEEAGVLAGEGAAGAGTAAGTGAGLGTGIDASTGLYAGESGVATTGSPTATGINVGPSTTGGVGSATSALSKILNGTATASDWASILGTVGSTALSVYGSDKQADTLREIANQARTDRQPFLDKSMQWLNDPASYAAGPGKAGLDAVLRGLSVQGNPFGSPTSLALAGDIANKNWQNAVTGFGNLGLSGQDSRNTLLSNAATADRGITTALGSGIGSLTQPDNSLEALLRRLSGGGLNTGMNLV